MPLNWFRRHAAEEQAPAQAGPAAPVSVPEPPAPAPAVEPAADGQPTAATRKRRRGSRGGRGRKKTGTTARTTAAAEEKAEKPEKPQQPEKPVQAEKAPAKRPERKPRERTGRPQTRTRTAPRRAPLPKAKRELLVSVDPGEKRVAVLEDDVVAEVYLERPEHRSIAGNIYLGTVDNVLPGMEAAFVEIGLEKNGFLYVDEIVGPEIEKGHGRKIQDLISRGQTILVQAVKDPMKTKGARLTTQISLPGRFVVLVPQGEGLGVSRRLDDDERTRLKDILKRLDVKEGGVIVRTAAEGASEEDIERDLVFLQRLWRSIQAKAKSAKAPELVYQEAELPLRVVRDLFTGDFEKAYVDDERTHRRLVGYLKKTSPHMAERVVRYKEKTPLMEAFGVDQEIKSTIGRRIDLPSGGYLIFDYAEAFTVIDVNTGRFVGSRGKNSGSRLEDTITKNNLEAVKEVVRQLRLRDIGGIIVIDFIDMANPKNRVAVEEALRTELERDRTKTYVVEISPLGLVEMTRQNVTDGPRELMTKKCPTCGGDGIVYSEASLAIDVERRLRSLVAGSRSQAYRVELAAPIAAVLIGPGAKRLEELESLTKRRFFLVGKPDMHVDHFVVLAEGKLTDLAPKAPVAEGAELQLDLVEIDRHDSGAAVGKVEGFDVCVAEAAALVGKKAKVRVERVLDGVAYATLVRALKKVPEPLTAEAEAEKPTRKPPARKGAGAQPGTIEADADDADDADVAETDEDEDEVEVEVERVPAAEAEVAIAEIAVDGEAADGVAADGEAAAPVKKKTRRGSRGGKNRRKPAGTAAAAPGAPGAEVEPPEAEPPKSGAPELPQPELPQREKHVTIHVPSPDFGREGEAAAAADTSVGAAAPAEAPSENGAAAVEKKKTRRGSRGGKNRRKPAGAGSNGVEPAALAEPGPVEPASVEEPSTNGTADEDWGYVPMSEWVDELEG